MEDLEQKLDKFIEQYEIDMRGDKELNGNRGIIGNLRHMKKIQTDYPSLTWLFAHRPFPTITTILFVYVLLTALSQYGVLRFFMAYFGLPSP